MSCVVYIASYVVMMTSYAMKYAFFLQQNNNSHKGYQKVMFTNSVESKCGCLINKLHDTSEHRWIYTAQNSGWAPFILL